MAPFLMLPLYGHAGESIESIANSSANTISVTGSTVAPDVIRLKDSPITSTVVGKVELDKVQFTAPLGGGHSREEIVTGVHFSIAKRTIRLTKRVGINDVLYFDGGPALNKGLVAAIEDELGKKLAIPETPQVTTAFGAAIQGQEVHLYELSGERESA